jgi:hypothetical protein
VTDGGLAYESSSLDVLVASYWSIVGCLNTKSTRLQYCPHGHDLLVHSSGVSTWAIQQDQAIISNHVFRISLCWWKDVKYSRVIHFRNGDRKKKNQIQILLTIDYDLIPRSTHKKQKIIELIPVLE